MEKEAAFHIPVFRVRTIRVRTIRSGTS